MSVKARLLGARVALALRAADWDNTVCRRRMSVPGSPIGQILVSPSSPGGPIHTPNVGGGIAWMLVSCRQPVVLRRQGNGETATTCGVQATWRFQATASSVKAAARDAEIVRIAAQSSHRCGPKPWNRTTWGIEASLAQLSPRSEQVISRHASTRCRIDPLVHERSRT